MYPLYIHIYNKVCDATQFLDNSIDKILTLLGLVIVQWRKYLFDFTVYVITVVRPVISKRTLTGPCRYLFQALSFCLNSNVIWNLEKIFVNWLINRPKPLRLIYINLWSSLCSLILYNICTYWQNDESKIWLILWY